MIALRLQHCHPMIPAHNSFRICRFYLSHMGVGDCQVSPRLRSMSVFLIPLGFKMVIEIFNEDGSH
jgi:hypothetical protein